MNYEDLLTSADACGLIVKEKPLQSYDGRIKGRRVAIRKDLTTSTEKACVLAEELGHYYTTSGDILTQETLLDQKQECRARFWSYNKLVGLTGIINAYKNGCRNRYEMADFLGITETFLSEALSSYHSKYGLYVTIDNYVIYFEPALGVLELL